MLLILPVFFDVEAPLPLQVNILIVVGEEAVDGVRSSSHQTRGRVFWRRGIRLDLGLRRVGANHVGHFVNYNGEKAWFK